MSIASQITALGQDKEAIKTAIEGKGGTVSQNYGFDTFAADIENIPFASGVVEFNSQSTSMTVTGLSFTPKTVTIFNPKARSEGTISGSYSWGTAGYHYESDTNRNFGGMGWTVNSGNSFVWPNNAENVPNYITINPNGENGFTISFTNFIFPADSKYFWFAAG